MKVHFFLRGIKKAQAGNNLEKKLPVSCQLEIDGIKRDVPFQLPKQVPAKYWNPSSSDTWVTDNYFMSEQINAYLRQVVLKFTTIFDALGILDDIPTYKLIRKIYEYGSLQKYLEIKSANTHKSFISVFDELIETQKKRGRRRSTLKTYNTRRNNFYTFLTENALQKLSISHFRYKHGLAFYEWLSKQRNKEGLKNFSIDTMNKHFTLIKMVLDYAVNEEYILQNPIARLFMDYEKAKPPTYLLPNQRQAIINCKIKSLEKERDVSVFLMHTGLSYTDYLSLSSSELHVVKDGFIFLKKQRDKSQIYSITPLLMPRHTAAYEVLQKYQTIENLPRPEISDLNKALKILAEVCGIDIELKTSDFRETFSCMMENEFMIDQRPLMKMMGHSNPKQLKNYSDVMPARLLYELEKQMPIVEKLDISDINLLK